MKKILFLVMILSMSLLLISLKRPFKVNADKCIGCKLCVSKCPVGAIKMVKGKAVIDAKMCVGCGVCADGDGYDFNGCPVEAIKQIGNKKIKPDSICVDSTKADSLRK